MAMLLNCRQATSGTLAAAGELKNVSFHLHSPRILKLSMTVWLLLIAKFCVRDGNGYRPSGA